MFCPFCPCPKLHFKMSCLFNPQSKARRDLGYNDKKKKREKQKNLTLEKLQPENTGVFT